MASKDDVMVVNDYGAHQGSLKRRTSRTGRQRYTVTIKSEPILVQTDPRALSKGPAEAIAEHLRQSITGITATASAATQRTREKDAKAFDRGAPNVLRRYAGGRIGAMRPNSSDRLFNDSGRFADSIAVGAIADGWVVNVAGNRLDPRTLNGGEAALLRIVARLRELVPEWGNGQALVDVLSVQRAINESMGESIRVAKGSGAGVDLAKQLMRMASGGARFFRQFR